MKNNIIIPEDILYIKGNKLSTNIIYNNKTEEIKQSINKYIDDICKYYGSSLKGRNASSSYILKNSYKCPIILSEKKNVILFKISDLYYTYWINYNNIFSINQLSDKIELIFNNDNNLLINCSKYIINNQITKSALLLSYLQSKI